MKKNPKNPKNKPDLNIKNHSSYEKCSEIVEFFKDIEVQFEKIKEVQEFIISASEALNEEVEAERKMINSNIKKLREDVDEVFSKVFQLEDTHSKVSLTLLGIQQASAQLNEQREKFKKEYALSLDESLKAYAIPEDFKYKNDVVLKADSAVNESKIKLEKISEELDVLSTRKKILTDLLNREINEKSIASEEVKEKRNLLSVYSDHALCLGKVLSSCAFLKDNVSSLKKEILQ